MNIDNFAVISINTKQYVVSKGDVLKVDFLPENAVLEVLLADNNGEVLVGKPNLGGFGISLQILEDKKDKKVSVRRFRNKSRYRRNNGHRQLVSYVKVVDFGKDINSEIVRKSVVDSIEPELVEEKTEVKPKVRKPRVKKPEAK